MCVLDRSDEVTTSVRVVAMWEQPATLERTDISVRAELRQVRVLRLVVAGALSLHDLEMDVVDDVRSAVSESCALVLGDSGAPGRLTLTLHCDQSGVTAEVQGTFDTPPERVPEDTMISERALKPFVNHCEVDLAQDRVTFDRLV